MPSSVPFMVEVPAAPSGSRVERPAAPRADLPGPVEKFFLRAGWLLVERFVAVVLFFKTGEFH